MRNPFRKREENADLDKEIRFHIEERKQTLMAQGLPPEEAHRQARVEFGAIDSVKEECRDAESTWLWRWTDELFGDLRHGIRLMAKKPLFAASMVLTLGICIGAVTAVFSVVDATLLRPLPYPEPERLAQLVLRSSFEGHNGLQSSQNGAT